MSFIFVSKREHEKQKYSTKTVKGRKKIDVIILSSILGITNEIRKKKNIAYDEAKLKKGKVHLNPADVKVQKS